MDEKMIKELAARAFDTLEADGLKVVKTSILRMLEFPYTREGKENLNSLLGTRIRQAIEDTLRELNPDTLSGR